MLISGHEVILRGTGAKVFTQEEREKIKWQVVELGARAAVRRYGNWKLKQVRLDSDERSCQRAGSQWRCIQLRLGLFPSEQARKDWQNARKKL